MTTHILTFHPRTAAANEIHRRRKEKKDARRCARQPQPPQLLAHPPQPVACPDNRATLAALTHHSNPSTSEHNSSTPAREAHPATAVADPSRAEHAVHQRRVRSPYNTHNATYR
jgi:hypothetical protein